jgi:ubiquinone/menaquinone biosynthesis C-methylase UbiE
MNANEAILVLADEYSRMAETYDRVVAPRFEPIARTVVEMLEPKSGHMTLDIGTGTGILACTIAPLVAPSQTVAIDLSDEAIRVASYRAGNAGVRNIRFEMMDARNIVYHSQLFDRIGSNFGIPDLGYDRTFYEAHRLMRPGGRFVFSEWDADPGPAAAAFYDLEERHGTKTPSAELGQIREARNLARTSPEAKDLRDPTAVARRLVKADFESSVDRPKVFPVRFDGIRAYIDFMSGFGWHERELREMTPDARAAFEADLAERLKDLTTTNGLEDTWHVHFHVALP